jgi:hypothetical protein
MAEAIKPSGAGAVMAAHAPAVVEGDDAEAALYRRLEFFPTPPWAARAGAELILKLDPGDWICWEPACGKGHMVHGLADYFRLVGCSDVHPYGYGAQFDFLGEASDAWPSHDGRWDWIVTNPPFGVAAEFVRLGLQRARRGVAILARAAFFESAGRYELFHGDAPLTVFAPFFERVPMALGKWDPKGSTATAYAWFVWRKPELSAGGATVCMSPRAIGIPPGTRARLTRPIDAQLFGSAGAAPLFDEARP